MAKYAKVGRFLKEDFEGAPGWFERFLIMFNRFKEQVENIVDRKITVTDNMDGEFRDIEVSTGGDISASFPLDFKLARKPKMVVCTQALDVTGEETPVPAPRIAWSWSNGQVYINGVGSGDLASSRRYMLTFLVLNS